MWLFWTLIILGILYIVIGGIKIYVDAQANDDEFKFDWTKILTWPKSIFGK